MNNFIESIMFFLAWLLHALVLSLIGAIPLMLLWNWLMPCIFGLAKVTFLQAFGLNYLSSLLFAKYVSKREGKPNQQPTEEQKTWETLNRQNRTKYK